MCFFKTTHGYLLPLGDSGIAHCPFIFRSFQTYHAPPAIRLPLLVTHTPSLSLCSTSPAGL